MTSGNTPVLVSVGLATAQGGVEEILAGAEPLPPAALPWPADRRTTSALCRPARGVDPALAGAERWHALARRALDECCGQSPPPTGTPLVIGSCNGAADSFETEVWRRSFDHAGTLDVAPWDEVRLPVVSAACASGLHALFLAGRLLEAGAEEAVVLAVDILSAACNRNFEALRILSPDLQAPWQPRTEGFLSGEAAVALRLRRYGDGLRLHGGLAPTLLGPVVRHDLTGSDGLGQVLQGFAPEGVDLIVGQGTGPADVDGVELEALRRAPLSLDVPLTTPLYHFGHTLGGSGLLSVALAALARRRRIAALDMPAARAADRRRLLTLEGYERSASQPADIDRTSSLVVCRALGGACAAVGLGPGDGAPSPPASAAWAEPVAPGPLHHPFLRTLATEALDHRPAEPPELLVVRLSEPLLPPTRAVFGGHLLPSAVLEITPGFIALLIARAWGYDGPALCLVGPRGTDCRRPNRRQDPADLLLPQKRASRKSQNPQPAARETHVIYIYPNENHVDWN